MFPLYSLLYLLALAVLFPREYLKRPPELRSLWLREKLGFPELKDYKPGQDSQHGQNEKTLWVHAVSVGEAIAAATFIREYKGLHPEDRIVVSTITDTGRAVAKERLSGLAQVIYLPFDFAGAVSRALMRVKPDIFVIMETELWPNLIRTVKAANIPVVLLNGRISDGSFRNYMKIKGFFHQVLKLIDIFCVQDDVYAERLRDLGVETNKIIKTGNFKFDVKVKDEELAWISRLNGKVIVAGSTHKGEDEILLSAYKVLLEKHKGLNLVIAPRHPQRFDDVWGLMKKESVYCIRRSALGEGDGMTGTVVLLDTVGELSLVYKAADIVVMGGSFIPHGGQNPLEPAYWGKPVLCGPHMENFPFIKEFYASGAALETSVEALASDLDDLLASSEARGEMGGRAKAILEKNRGAVDRAIRIVDSLTDR